MSYDFDDEDHARTQAAQAKSPAVLAALERGKGNRGGGGSGSSGGDHTKEAIESGKYTEVKVRLQLFYAAYPTGAIQTTKVKLYSADEFEDGKPRIRVDAKAWRTPDDPHPGTGTSWMVVPGTTPYTKNSEVENCETSAWGRAIAAVGIAIDKNIATVQEIRMKAGGEVEAPSLPAAQLAAAAAEAAGVTPVPDNAGDTAPEPSANPPVQESTEAGPSGNAEEATETAAEPEAAPEPVQTVKGQGKGKKEAPEAKPDTRMPEQVVADNKAAGIVEEPDTEAQVVAEVEAALTGDGEGLTMEEFSRLAREKFVPTGQIQSVVRGMIEAKQIRQVGKLSELTNQERLTVLLAAIAKQEG